MKHESKSEPTLFMAKINGRGEAVEPIPLLVGLGLGLGKPRLRVAVVAAVQLLHRDLVVVILQLLLQVLKIPLLGCKKRRTN